MTRQHQLKLWVSGKSWHHKGLDMHVPDMSCCCPELLASVEERQLFMARPDARLALENMFITAAILCGYITIDGGKTHVEELV